MQMKFDTQYNFYHYFDAETGFYFRSGIFDEDNTDSGVDPFMASYPHLLDVGIMGYCIHGETGLCASAGIGCYQSGKYIKKPNMSVDDFVSILEQCHGLVHQIALGGRGDPDQHEHFHEILGLCRSYDIVPNFTSSGFGMTADLARICALHCGAVAVSWYRSDYTLRAIRALIQAGVKTNIHYVLGRNSIDEAITRLEQNDFPDGVNAVIFLLHKPVGQGTKTNVLSADDPRVERFFRLIDNLDCSFKVGLDSCTVPGVIQRCSKQDLMSLDTCEGARFSAYISADMFMMPCSFDQNHQYNVSLRQQSIEEAWNSQPFCDFRTKLTGSCLTCSDRLNCMGGCPLMPEIVLCSKQNT